MEELDILTSIPIKKYKVVKGDEVMEKDRKLVKVSFFAEIDGNFLEELSGIVKHHLEYLLDLYNFSEIKTVFNGSVSEEEMEG